MPEVTARVPPFASASEKISPAVRVLQEALGIVAIVSFHPGDLIMTTTSFLNKLITGSTTTPETAAKLLHFDAGRERDDLIYGPPAGENERNLTSDTSRVHREIVFIDSAVADLSALLSA